MFNDVFSDTWVFGYIVIPVFIILARIVDVSIGTLRIIFVSKGMKIVAPILGFFEVIIWLLAIGQIMQNLTNVVNYIAYGFGFALGNYLGIYIERKLSIGFEVIRIITRRSATKLLKYLASSGYRFTMVDAQSDEGAVNVIYMPLKRRDVRNVIHNIKKHNPKAFYTLESLQSVSGDVGYLRNRKRWGYYSFVSSKMK